MDELAHGFERVGVSLEWISTRTSRILLVAIEYTSGRGQTEQEGKQLKGNCNPLLQYGYFTSSVRSLTRLWLVDGLKRFRLIYADQLDAGRYISFYIGFTIACNLAPTINKIWPSPSSVLRATALSHWGLFVQEAVERVLRKRKHPRRVTICLFQHKRAS